VGSDGESVIRRFYDLATVGDQACWDLWHQEAVSKAPPDFPESRETRGVEEIKRLFGSWQSIFGPDWWDGLSLDAVSQLPDGRVIAEVAFELAGVRSGAPLRKQAAVVYTFREGKIVRAEHFMDRSVAREAAVL
jgi:ketosteroid isomerase-like protein